MSSDLAEKARKVADRWYVNKDTSLQSLLAIQILSALREAVEAEREATIKAICEAFQHREPSNMNEREAPLDRVAGLSLANCYFAHHS